MATATAVAAGIAAAVYLDAKLGVTKDLRQLSMSRQFGQRLDQYIKDLGDQPTLYNLLVRANADADGLWFEGNTWSYRDIKEGCYPYIPDISLTWSNSRGFRGR